MASQNSARPPPDPAREANHHIANHLSMLVAIVQLQLPAIEAGPEQVPRELVADLLKDVAGKILAIGKLHRLLSTPSAPGEVVLGKAVESVVEALQSAGLFGDRLRVTSSLEGHRMDAGRASKLLLAFTEIATNAIKYAHPTGLPVELTIDGSEAPNGGFALQIADDGVGFPEGFVEVRDAGVGLGLVRSLVESAGGSLAIKSDPLGLTFSIDLRPARLQ